MTGFHTTMFLSCRTFLTQFIYSFTQNLHGEEYQYDPNVKGLTDFFKPMRIDLLVEDPILEMFDIREETVRITEDQTEQQLIPFGSYFCGRHVWFRCIIEENVTQSASNFDL